MLETKKYRGFDYKIFQSPDGWGFIISNENVEIKHKLCIVGPESAKASVELFIDVLDENIEF